MSGVPLELCNALGLSGNGGKIHSFFKKDHSAAPHQSEHVECSSLKNLPKEIQVKLKFTGNEQLPYFNLVRNSTERSPSYGNAKAKENEGQSMDRSHHLHPVGTTRSPQGRLRHPGPQTDIEPFQ
ncbi:hypothetical protein ACH5RR_001282 [Cinchona calisaya]|uniref:Uncharacterized protein n=1 Tax=Cinchona calisaya TaxID=153742 RepID=A0ABD3B380_9GENT